MIEQFKEAFREEAIELLNQLEAKLLELEANPKDAETVSSVFRTMHTIKGSSAMFGFESITRFIAPTLGGLMLERLGTGAPGVFSFAILALLTLYVWRFVYSVENPLIPPFSTPRAIPQVVEIKE